MEKALEAAPPATPKAAPAEPTLVANATDTPIEPKMMPPVAKTQPQLPRIFRGVLCKAEPPRGGRVRPVRGKFLRTPPLVKGTPTLSSMQRPPMDKPWLVVCSVWPVRSLLYLVAYTVGGLVTWAALSTVVLFPFWAGVWSRLERRLASLVGSEAPHRSQGVGAGVTWRELTHCLVSVPLSALGVIGGLALVAGAMSTVLAPLQSSVPFDRLWWFTPSTTTEYIPAALLGVFLAPIVAWLLTAVALGVDTLSLEILAPPAKLLSRTVDVLRAASLRAEDDVLLERRRLQQHLHDGVQLHLSVTGARLAVLQYDIETHVPQAHRDTLLQGVDDVRDQLQAAMDQVRHAVTGLAPRRLTDEGLCAALSELRQQMPFDMTVTCAVPRLPAQVETDLYLIISESLTNAVKHAQARTVTVDLRVAGKEVVATVSDDGVGGVDREGRGILGMESRVDRLAGTLTFRSPPGGGTSVIVHLPKVVT